MASSSSFLGALMRPSARNVVFVTLAILAMQAVGGIVLARALGPADRGILAALVLWATLAADLGGLGVAYGVSFAAAEGWGQRALRLTRSAMPLLWIIGLVSFVFLVLVSGRSNEIPTAAAILLAVWVFGQIGGFPLQRLQQGLDRMSAFDRLRFVAQGLPPIGYLAFAVVGLLSITAAAGSLAAFVLLAGVWGVMLARPFARSDGVEPKTGTGFWSYSLRSWTSLLASRLNASTDLLVISLLAVSAADVGTYAVAASSTLVIATIGASLGLDLFPRVVTATHDAAVRLIRSYLGAVAALAIVASVVFFVLAGWLIPALYGEAFADAVEPARILLVGVVAASIASVAGQGLSALGHPGRNTVAQAVGAGVTAVGVLGFGSESLEGVAWAATAGYAVTMVLALGFVWTTLSARRSTG